VLSEILDQAHRETSQAMAIPPEILGVEVTDAVDDEASIGFDPVVGSFMAIPPEILVVEAPDPVFDEISIGFDSVVGSWDQKYTDETLAEVISIQLELIKELRNTVDATHVMRVRSKFGDKYVQLAIEPDWHRKAGGEELAGKWLDVLTQITQITSAPPGVARRLGQLIDEEAWADAPDRLPESSYVHLCIDTRLGDAYVTAYVIPRSKSVHEVSFAFCSPGSQFERAKGRALARKRHADGQKVLLASGGTRSRHDMVEEWIQGLRSGTRALCTLQDEHTVPLPRWLLPEPQVMSVQVRRLLTDLAGAAERFADSTHDAALALQSFGRRLSSLGRLAQFSSTWSPAVRAVSDDELNNVGADPDETWADEEAAMADDTEVDEFAQIFDELIEQECSS